MKNYMKNCIKEIFTMKFGNIYVTQKKQKRYKRLFFVFIRWYMLLFFLSVRDIY